MKKFLLSTALLVPLSGCGWLWEKSLADFILDDLLGCEGVRNEWPCTAQYLGSDKGEFLGDHKDHHERPERNREPEQEHGEY